jgi:ornithine cyclodeaminase/alanine dehydrogenase-like protein (mu-crystallin family)
LTLILTEENVQSLLDMKEVIGAVEEAFRREGAGEATNTMRTRSRGEGSVLNVMHATLSYLRRGGLKAYMSSASGARFVLVLFDSSNSTPLAVMGADNLGRYRTGAASGVATKHLYKGSSGTLALFGSGKQALAQAQALGAVMSLEGVRVWSPNPKHREAFVAALSELGFSASSFDSPQAALEGTQVACTITSSKEPFLTAEMLAGVAHTNLCGGNVPHHSEVTPQAVGSFTTVVVDDLPQAKVEYGDLIQAVQAGTFTWEGAVGLSDIVSGKKKAGERTLFKSGGAALEDVAVASMLYDKAVRSGMRLQGVELG